MPPILSEEEALLDPYTLLEVAANSSEKDIQRAYRKKSLKFHPDRNPGPEAAIKFREISLALEILLDVGKRSYVDNKLEGDRKRKEKTAKLDSKRKEMVDALVAREEDAKKAKVERAKATQLHAEEEAIKDAGKKLREAAQLKAAALAESQKDSNRTFVPDVTPNTATNRPAEAQPIITPLDLTLSLQFPPTSDTAQSSSQALQSLLQNRYGPISHTILRDPPDTDAAEGVKKKKKKGKKAIIEFEGKNWGGCWACWKDHQGDKGATGIEEGVKAKWVGNSGAQPDWVEWATKQPSITSTRAKDRPEHDTLSAPAFGSAPNIGGGVTMADLLDQHRSRNVEKARNEEFESMTLLKMRQMERERLAEQIRREEEEDES